MSFLSVDRISKRFGGITAVDQVSFGVDRGQVVGFLGPNGAGKSTTMRMITQYYEPDGGTIRLDGVPVEEVGRQIFEEILAVASGQKTKSELGGVGEEEFAPWSIGPTL